MNSPLKERDLKRLFAKLKIQLNDNEKTLLIKRIDSNYNNKIEIFEIIDFFVTFCGK